MRKIISLKSVYLNKVAYLLDLELLVLQYLYNMIYSIRKLNKK